MGTGELYDTWKSLFLSSDEVNRFSDDGWVGPLDACEGDAEDMRALASGVGFHGTPWLRRDATRAAALGQIGATDKALEEGDRALPFSDRLHSGTVVEGGARETTFAHRARSPPSRPRIGDAGDPAPPTEHGRRWLSSSWYPARVPSDLVDGAEGVQRWFESGSTDSEGLRSFEHSDSHGDQSEDPMLRNGA